MLSELLRPLAVVFDFEALGFDLEAGDGGVVAEGFVGVGAEAKTEGGAGLADGSDAVLKKETELDSGVAGIKF